MTPLQKIFIAFTFFGPPLLWLVSKKVESPRFARSISWTFAIVLAAAHITGFFVRRAAGDAEIDQLLPMQLCDWASFATIIALIAGRRTPFELAYFWGIAGTSQALFTPAIAIEWDMRSITFLTLHALIPAGVLWLMFEYKKRPQVGAWVRVALWSQVFLVSALLVNYFTNSNYAFLMHPPDRPSLLDHFPKHPVLYVLALDAFGMVIFFLLDLPWQILRRRRGTAHA